MKDKNTAFALLSPAAQEFIVNAAMGAYEQSGPPDIPEPIKAEISAWAAQNEEY